MSVSLFFDSPRDMQLSRAIATCCVLALAVRRRFPETCALIVFVLSVVQLVFLGLIEVGHIVASLCALYSAVLYGREHGMALDRSCRCHLFSSDGLENRS